MTRSRSHLVTAGLVTLSAFGLLGPAAAQGDQPHSEDAIRVFEGVRRNHDRIASLELTIRYDTENVADSGDVDYLFSHVRILRADAFWIDRFHSNASGVRGLDPERILRIGKPDQLHVIRPAYRTIRSAGTKARREVASRPEPYFAALAWWPKAPTDEDIPKVGSAPLSIAAAIEDRDSWVVRPGSEPGHFILASEKLATEFVVDENKRWAVRSRTLRREKTLARFEAEGFQEVQGVFLPSAVRQVSIDRADDSVELVLRCEADHVAVGELDESDLDVPNLPGLYDLSDEFDESTQLRQIVRGGEDLLVASGTALRREFGSPGSEDRVGFLIALCAGAVLGIFVGRRVA